MLIGILSDTHDHVDRLRNAVARFQQEKVDIVIHAGDLVAPFAVRALLEWNGPLHVVYGNNDGERRGLKSLLPQIEDGPILVNCGGLKINVDHYPPDDVHQPLDEADVLVYGHTHQIVNERREGVLHLNPGECCGWVTGTATIATLDTDTLRAEIIHLEQ